MGVGGLDDRMRTNTVIPIMLGILTITATLLDRGDHSSFNEWMDKVGEMGLRALTNGRRPAPGFP